MSPVQKKLKTFQHLSIDKKIDYLEWLKLTEDEKWHKDVVVAMISHYDYRYLPLQYREESWCGNNDNWEVPSKLLEDRDVVLARLRCPDFLRYYTTTHESMDTDRRLILPTFTINEGFLGDKEVLVAAIHQYPEVLLLQCDQISENLLNDDEVFQAYLNSMRWGKDLHGNKDDGLTFALPRIFEKFSDRIRSNTTFVLQAADKGAFVLSFASTGFVINAVDDALALLLTKGTDKTALICDTHRRNGKSAFPEDAFARHFSKELRSHPDVVLQAVKRNGLCLKYAANPLHWNENIIKAACEDNPVALVLSRESPARTKLCGQKQFMLNIFQGLWCWDSRNKVRYPELYQWLSAELKVDRDIIEAAAQVGCLDTDDIPEEQRTSKSLWLYLLSQHGYLFHILPQEMETDIELVMAIREHQDFDFVANIFQRLPHLQDDRDFWMNMINPRTQCDCFASNDLGDVLEHLAPDWVLHDKELMLRAVELDPWTTEKMPPIMTDDRDLVEMGVSKSEYSLHWSKYLPVCWRGFSL